MNKFEQMIDDQIASIGYDAIGRQQTTFQSLEVFKDFFDPIATSHLEARYEQDADEDGPCAFPIYEMDYQGDECHFIIDAGGYVNIRRTAEITLELFDEDGNSIPVELSEEQREYVLDYCEDALQEWCESEAEGRERSRDIYAYHGVSRSDFI